MINKSSTTVETTLKLRTSTVTTKSTEKNQKYKRESKICPVCKKANLWLKRHLISVHEWSEDRARNVISEFKLRKNYERKQEVSKPLFQDYRKEKKCPVIGCFYEGKRLSVHLQGRHKLPKLSNEYELYMGLSKQNSNPTKSFDKRTNEEGRQVTSQAARKQCIINESITFYDWLQSYDGGRKEKASAELHQSHIKTLHNTITEDSHFSDTILDKNMIKKYYLERYAT